jgi:hypothetical protein
MFQSPRKCSKALRSNLDAAGRGFGVLIQVGRGSCGPLSFFVLMRPSCSQAILGHLPASHSPIQRVS